MDQEDFCYFYKFLPFDAGSLCVLTKGTLKYTNPLHFNDPFDCWPVYADVDIKTIAIKRRRLIRDIAKKRGLKGARLLQNKHRIAAELAEYIQSAEARQARLSKMGVVSLTTDASNILMWSHYAQQHQGFVAEFKVPQYGTIETAEAMGEYLLPQEVRYSNRRPVINHVDDSDDSIFENAVLMKSSDWAYENEHRVIDFIRGPGIHQYKRELLNAVITGMNMPKQHRSQLREAVNETAKTAKMKHLRLYEAKPDKERYRIHIPGHPRWDIEV